MSVNSGPVGWICVIILGRAIIAPILGIPLPPAILTIWPLTRFAELQILVSAFTAVVLVTHLNRLSDKQKGLTRRYRISPLSFKLPYTLLGAYIHPDVRSR